MQSVFGPAARRNTLRGSGSFDRRDGELKNGLDRTTFGKMARTVLRHIRVASWDERKARILRSVAEINAAPRGTSLEEFEGLDEVMF